MANTYLSKNEKYFTLNGKLLQYPPAPLVAKGDLIKLDLDNKKRHKKKKIKEMFNNFKTQKDSQQKFNERYVSTQAHLNKGNTYGFQKQYLI